MYKHLSHLTFIYVYLGIWEMDIHISLERSYNVEEDIIFAYERNWVWITDSLVWEMNMILLVISFCYIFFMVYNIHHERRELVVQFTLTPMYIQNANEYQHWSATNLLQGKIEALNTKNTHFDWVAPVSAIKHCMFF